MCDRGCLLSNGHGGTGDRSFKCGRTSKMWRFLFGQKAVIQFRIEASRYSIIMSRNSLLFPVLELQNNTWEYTKTIFVSWPCESSRGLTR